MGVDKLGRPKLRFHDQRQIRPPVIQKAPHPVRPINRDELMKRAVRKSAGHHPRRGYGAGGHQNMPVRRGFKQLLDKHQGGDALADTGGVQPDQFPVRPR